MERRDRQKEIDAVRWYHEFDFGDGLRAQTEHATAYHRLVWDHIRAQLDQIDFRGKTVLDLGCWDGYWSFYAERRGAKSVLASDDLSQSWSDGRGLRLAKELLRSNVEINQHQSIYELSALGRRFDIVLCLGVYYHLLDPFYAFAEVRHCCHPGTVVVVEGDGLDGGQPDAVRFNLSDLSQPIFLPTAQALRHLLEASYLGVASHAWCPLPDPARTSTREPRLGWRWRLGLCAQALAGSGKGVGRLWQQVEPAYRFRRLVTVCRPLNGVNPVHHYKPPFGLHAYDDRFRSDQAAA